MKSKTVIFGYYLANFLTALQFVLPIWLIYYTITVGFSVTEAMILGSASYFVSTILEIPTGVIADKYSPKISYVIGAILIAISSIFYLFTPSFWLYLASAVLEGVGYALMSGCLESLMYEYLLESKQENNYPKITSNKQSIFFIGRILASLSAFYFFGINPVLPFLLVGLLHILSIFFVLNIKISHTAHLESLTKSIFKKAISKIIEVLKQQPILGYLVLIALVETFVMDMYFYSYPLFLKELGIDLSLSGYLFAFVSIFSAIGSQLFHKFFAKSEFVSVLIIGISLILTPLFVFLNTVWAFGLALFIQGISSGFVFPAFNTFWQPKVEKEYRTTLTSIFSFLVGILSVTGAFVAGLVIDNFGISSLKNYLFLAVIFILPLLLIWINLGRDKSFKGH